MIDSAYQTFLGIGVACALALAEAGATICLIVRPNSNNSNINNNTSTIDALRAIQLPNADHHTTIECDLSNPDAVRTLFDRALDKLGGNIHVLVNCAGIQRRAPAVEFSEQDWDDVSYFLFRMALSFIIATICILFYFFWVPPPPCLFHLPL